MPTTKEEYKKLESDLYHKYKDHHPQFNIASCDDFRAFNQIKLWVAYLHPQWLEL